MNIAPDATPSAPPRRIQPFPDTSKARRHLSLLIALYADDAYKTQRTALVDILNYLDVTERRVRGHRQKRMYLDALIEQIMTMR